MADFVAVLRKTIDGLHEATPEARAKVYSKARTTISAKLAAINPPPPPALADRQMRSLEDAIRTVEAEYNAAEARQDDNFDPAEDLETAIASLGTPRVDRSWPPAAQAAPQERFQPQEPPMREPDAWSPDEEDHFDEPPPVRRAEERRRGFAGLLTGLGLLVVLGGAGYAAWANKDQIAGIFGSDPESVAVAPAEPVVVAPAEPVETAAETPAPVAAEPEAPVAEAAAPETPEEPEVEVAAADPQADTVPADAAPAAPEVPAVDAPVEKFTQRLRSDGTEIDEGPAGGEPGIGEGTSVAALTAAAPPQPQTPAPLEAPQPNAQAAPAGQQVAAAEPAVAVGQKAIFYEERTNVEQGSADNGSVVWTLVQESPGGDLPPEPAIRAEATIPQKDIQLRMTIRRNGDQTLPASHIVEMIFLTPDDFEGGGIDNVLRIALKDSEQAAGNPLLGIPAKIADGFFLVALSDGPAEIQANTTLLRRQSWIDVPIVYRSGRRALITLEKGIPGDKVFDEALRAWQASSSG
jgi:hypothetical protein